MKVEIQLSMSSENENRIWNSVFQSRRKMKNKNRSLNFVFGNRRKTENANGISNFVFKCRRKTVGTMVHALEMPSVLLTKLSHYLRVGCLRLIAKMFSSFPCSHNLQVTRNEPFISGEFCGPATLCVLFPRPFAETCMAGVEAAHGVLIGCCQGDDAPVCWLPWLLTLVSPECILGLPMWPPLTAVSDVPLLPAQGTGVFLCCSVDWFDVCSVDEIAWSTDASLIFAETEAPGFHKKLCMTLVTDFAESYSCFGLTFQV